VIDLVPAAGLLGAHVAHRPDGRTDLRQPRIIDDPGRPGVAEVGDQGASTAQQDVGRLDVAVHDPLLVGGLNRLGHIGGDSDSVGDGKGALAVQSLPQRLPLHEGHHVVEHPIGLSRVEEGQDVGMLQRCRRSDLGQESLPAHGGGEFRLEHLEGHAPLVPLVGRQIDDRHPPFAHLPLESVAAREGGLQSSKGVLHRAECLGFAESRGRPGDEPPESA
jgi:hypothetical protein